MENETTQPSERDELLFIAMRNNIKTAEQIEAQKGFDCYAFASAQAYRRYARDCFNAIAPKSYNIISLRRIA